MNRRHFRGFAMAGLLVASCAPAMAAGQPCEARRGIAPVEAGPAEPCGDIGLTARLDRRSPVYAVGEAMTLTIRVRRAATIEVWELDQSGRLSRIAPAEGQALTAGPAQALVLPRGPQRYVIAGPPGISELRIIARAAPPAQPTRDVGTASARLSHRALRQDLRLCYRIVAAP
jgi:hypothetical protein